MNEEDIPELDGPFYGREVIPSRSVARKTPIKINFKSPRTKCSDSKEKCNSLHQITHLPTITPILPSPRVIEEQNSSNYFCNVTEVEEIPPLAYSNASSQKFDDDNGLDITTPRTTEKPNRNNYFCNYTEDKEIPLLGSSIAFSQEFDDDDNELVIDLPLIEDDQQELTESPADIHDEEPLSPEDFRNTEPLSVKVEQEDQEDNHSVPRPPSPIHFYGPNFYVSHPTYVTFAPSQETVQTNRTQLDHSDDHQILINHSNINRPASPRSSIKDLQPSRPPTPLFKPNKKRASALPSLIESAKKSKIESDLELPILL